MARVLVLKASFFSVVLDKLFNFSKAQFLYLKIELIVLTSQRVNVRIK